MNAVKIAAKRPSCVNFVNASMSARASRATTYKYEKSINLCVPVFYHLLIVLPHSLGAVLPAGRVDQLCYTVRVIRSGLLSIII